MIHCYGYIVSTGHPSNDRDQSTDIYFTVKRGQLWWKEVRLSILFSFGERCGQLSLTTVYKSFLKLFEVIKAEQRKAIWMKVNTKH